MKNLKTSALAVLFIAFPFFAQYVFAQKNKKDRDGYIQMFNGKDLEGWEYDTAYWRVENGILVGEITPDKIITTNTFIIWKGAEPSDFELKLEYRISEDGNSGINYRSERRTDVAYGLRGYQSDIDGKNKYTGQNYEENKRTTLAYIGQKTVVKTVETGNESLRGGVRNNAWTGFTVTGTTGNADSLRARVRKNDWNEVHLVVRGNRMQHFVNGQLMSEVVDEDLQNRSMKGLVGVQVHVGPPMKVEFRKMKIRMDSRQKSR